MRFLRVMQFITIAGGDMSLIYTTLRKKKAKKPNLKQRQLQADWEALLKRHSTPSVKKQTSANWVYSLETPKGRETTKIQSLNSGYHDCSKKDVPVYTGTAMKGIGTMHKSNSVPIFSDEEAVAIATMRRN